MLLILISYCLPGQSSELSVGLSRFDSPCLQSQGKHHMIVPGATFIAYTIPSENEVGYNLLYPSMHYFYHANYMSAYIMLIYALKCAPASSWWMSQQPIITTN